MLISLEADPTVEDDKGATAQQVAVSRMVKVVKDFNSGFYDYNYFDEKIGSCEACTAKKTDYWDELDEEMFTECFNECPDAPCYPKFP